MRRRILLSLVGAAALSLGLALTYATAKPAPPGPDAKPRNDPTHKGEGKQRGKAGDLCDSDQDCAQKPRVLTCREHSGDRRCAPVVVHLKVT